MGIFTPKNKNIEVTFIEEKIILIKGEKWHKHDHEMQEIRNALALLIKQNKKIMATQKELALAIQAAADEATKAKAEILAKIAELQTALDNAGNTTPEVDAAMQNLKDAVQGIDDIVPDAPTT